LGYFFLNLKYFFLWGFEIVFDPIFDLFFQRYDFLFLDVNRGTNHPVTPNRGNQGNKRVVIEPEGIKEKGGWP
jgi:hypothetical protein